MTAYELNIADVAAAAGWSRIFTSEETFFVTSRVESTSERVNLISPS